MTDLKISVGLERSPDTGSYDLRHVLTVYWREKLLTIWIVIDKSYEKKKKKAHRDIFEETQMANTLI